MIVIISCCSARKDDSCPIPLGARQVVPADYLIDIEMVERLQRTQREVLKDPRARLGSKTTYAFDLYT
jgi:hypothetical protein